MTTVAGTTICTGCKGAVLLAGERVLDAAPSAYGIYGEDGVVLRVGQIWKAKQAGRPIGHLVHRCPKPVQGELPGVGE